MIDFLRKQRAPSSILGLSLDGSRLEGVVVRRSNGSLQVQKTFAVSLVLNPFTADPELVGREIRNHLEQASIRERRCAVCLSSALALVVQTKVPDLPQADVESFLQIEAERGFPYGPESLSVCTSRYRSAGGEQHATLVAIPREQLTRLENALKAARLRPVSFTLGLTALQIGKSAAAGGVLALAVGEESVGLQVTCGGGVAVLRSLDGAIETEGAQRHLDADLLAREIRITIGQLPAELRESVGTVRIFGRGDHVERFAQEFKPSVQSMGMRLELVKAYALDEFRSKLPADATVSPSLSVAAGCLTGAKPRFEFLPPKVNQWQQLTARFSSKKLVWAGATAGSVALLVGGAFFIQQWQLWRWQSRWEGMSKRVAELEKLQQQIRKYRPWFDESVRSLSILRRLTEAFPEDGTVSAKTVEIRSPATVTCMGTAQNNQALQKTLDQLRTCKEISDVKTEHVKGSSPVEFTFNFRWSQASVQ
jgi:hypothetical protein